MLSPPRRTADDCDSIPELLAETVELALLMPVTQSGGAFEQLVLHNDGGAPAQLCVEVPQQGVLAARGGGEIRRAVNDAGAGDEHSSNCRWRVRQIGTALFDRSARLINAKGYGVKVGSEAEVTVLDAKSPAEAVAVNAPVLAVFKRGRQTVSRPRAELMRP